MPELSTSETLGSTEPEFEITEWNTKSIGATYIGRLAHVSYLKSSETNAYEPYIKDALHRVSGVEVEEDGSIAFLMTKLEVDEASYDPKVRVRVVTRSGLPDEIIFTESREVWVYGDRKDPENDQIITFSL